MAAMSPQQLMRAVLAALASPATFAKGLVMARRQPAAAAQGAPPPSASAFRQHHRVVFVDPSGYVNLAAHVQPSGLAQVLACLGPRQACNPQCCVVCVACRHSELACRRGGTMW